MSDRVHGPKSVPRIPYRPPVCGRRQFGDSVWCDTCRKRWDYGDEPEYCLKQTPPRREDWSAFYVWAWSVTLSVMVFLMIAWIIKFVLSRYH